MDYNVIIKQYYNKKFWDLVDEYESIRTLIKKFPDFADEFSCRELNVFCNKTKEKRFIVWGAGKDGKAVIYLLKCLKITVDYWIDSNESLPEVIAAKKIVELYSGQNIIIASRKYWEEIADELEQLIENVKEKIFQYDFFKTLYLQKKEFMKKSVLSYPPLWMTIGVTSACSHRCLFCAYHGEAAKNVSKVYGLGYMLKFNEYKRMVDMAYDGGVPRIHICGTGEPFYNPDILKMIDYTIFKYGEVSIQTDFCKELYDKNDFLNEIIKREGNISYIATDILSGIPSEHEKIKLGSSYESLMGSLEYIAKNSSIIIKVVIILTKQNYRGILEMMDELEKRKIVYEMLIVNLLPYEYSSFTSRKNVYSVKDKEIIEYLQKVKDRARKTGVSIVIPEPSENEEECYVFWTEFQTWPVYGCNKERYVENMIPHACAAVVRGELNSLGYIFDYKNIMEAWNNTKLVEIRENMINGRYPDKWCEHCMFNKSKENNDYEKHIE